MLDMVKAISLYLAAGVEAAAAIIIGIAAIEATLRALRIFVQHEWTTRVPGAVSSSNEKEQVRLRLGRWLAVALEFELAADILRTGIARLGTRSASWRRSPSCGPGSTTSCSGRSTPRRCASAGGGPRRRTVHPHRRSARTGAADGPPASSIILLSQPQRQSLAFTSGVRERWFVLP